MHAASRSIRLFGIYLVCLGPILILVPNLLLAAFGFPATEEPWIRVLGIAVAALGYYYLVAATNEYRAFFRATVSGRLFLFLAFIGLVVLGMTKPMLLLFGAADAAGGLWTWRALRADARP